MVKMINASTGSIMWVADERKDEYLGAGHKLAPVSQPKAKKPAEPKKEAKEDVTEKVTEPKKTSKKKK